MNEIRKQWIAALRSGKYKQGTGNLRRCNDEFCCLGVLCEVVREKAVLPDGGSHYRYDGQGGILPYSVRQVVGINNPFGRASNMSNLPDEIKTKILHAGHDPWGPVTLAGLNDAGVPFDVIADIIESEPEGLFEDE